MARLLVFHVSHIKENFSLLRFEEELLGIPPLLTPSDTLCHVPLRHMNIINGIKSGGAPVHTSPVNSDLRGVDAGSVVTSGSGQRVQCQEMAASRK